MTSDAETTNVFLRNDTIFGTMQAIGDDFGINPNWLRVPLAATMLASPIGAIAVYFGLSVVVLTSRLVFRTKVAPVSSVLVAIPSAEIEANDDRRELIAA